MECCCGCSISLWVMFREAKVCWEGGGVQMVKNGWKWWLLAMFVFEVIYIVLMGENNCVVVSLHNFLAYNVLRLSLRMTFNRPGGFFVILAFCYKAYAILHTYRPHAFLSAMWTASPTRKLIWCWFYYKVGSWLIATSLTKFFSML